MDTNSKEFMFAVYTIVLIHVVLVSVILYKRYKKKSK